MRVSSSFIASHPFRVDLADAQHVRFTSLALAVGSAVRNESGVFDERTDRLYTFGDVIKMFRGVPLT